MQIGEFAKICDTKISVLRHYDKEGLLSPDYIDRFTGYRYYKKEQIADFKRISALKKAGFSLAEIKEIFAVGKNDNDILNLFESKEKQLKETFINLNEAKKMMLGVEKMSSITFTVTRNGITAKTFDSEDSRNAIEKNIALQGYQRISVYKTEKNEVFCDVIKLNNESIEVNEDIDLPFINDESIIGKWETVGEFAVKEDFYSGEQYDELNCIRNVDGLYFLPGGEKYWCYGWTKGKLLIDNGTQNFANSYTTEVINGKRYMFIDYKSYNYFHGGKTTVLVLRQIDNKSYSANEIARKDKIDLPFVNDEQVIGKWKSFSFCKRKENFDPSKQLMEKWFWSDVEFKPNGEVVSYYDWGNDVIYGRDKQEWTKGFLLRKWNNSACAYEFKIIDGKEYLFIEWKSGDYRWGGFDTDYYVFVRV